MKDVAQTRVNKSDEDAQRRGEPWANWLWLIETDARSNLLVIGAGPELGVVADRFANVESQLSVDGGIRHLDDSFDAVAVRGISPFDAGAPLTPWAECYRVLRKGGTLYLDGLNPGWFRTLRPGWRFADVLGLRRVAADLRRTGFRDVRTYYLESTLLDCPRVLVPGERRAVLAWERFGAAPGLRRIGRLMIAALGLPELLYPAAVILARK